MEERGGLEQEIELLKPPDGIVAAMAGCCRCASHALNGCRAAEEWKVISQQSSRPN